jgi:hypothetical protein
LGLLVFGGALGAFAWERSGRLKAERQAQWNQDRQDFGSRLIDQARAAVDLEPLEELNVALSKLGVDIRDAPGLEGLRSRVDDSLHEVKTRIDEIKLRDVVLAQQREKNERLQTFRARETEAIFRDTVFTELDLPSNPGQIRRAALAALDLYAAPGSGDVWAPGPRLASLSPHDQADVKEGCYELLLVLSRAEPTPKQGLSRLEQASRLHPPTRAYHLRKADYLAQLGDAASADRERRAADRQEPTTASELAWPVMSVTSEGNPSPPSGISTTRSASNPTISGPSASRPSAGWISSGPWRPTPA